MPCDDFHVTNNLLTTYFEIWFLLRSPAAAVVPGAPASAVTVPKHWKQRGENALVPLVSPPVLKEQPAANVHWEGEEGCKFQYQNQFNSPWSGNDQFGISSTDLKSKQDHACYFLRWIIKKNSPSPQ